ncbi:MAG TPA: GTP-binding protein [Spongiibacteraceae bacterium]|nr:GTP-binding protein [Spongiibacteraceae bacterium]
MKKPIPTNLITGFLGTGKTTAVLDLLRKKPVGEKWAVLVNEFGEVGIDGAILRGSGAEIREVAGGCMCCVADLPMKVALNALIARAKPDRLLIETTGLGHPQALIDTLTDEPYGELLELDAVICLVDPRKLREQRYLEHKIFRDQLNIADIVVANKTDLCDADDKLVFSDFVTAQQPPKQAWGWSTQGQLQLQWLSLKHGGQRIAPRNTPQKNNLLRMPMPPLPPLSLATDELFTRRENSVDGYFSCGWLFAGQVTFEYSTIVKLLEHLNIARFKGLIKTEQGNYVFNDRDGMPNIEPVGELADSIVELIHDEAADWQHIEQSLLDAFYRPQI